MILNTTCRAQDSACGEQRQRQGYNHCYFFGATCGALHRLGESLGHDVVFLGVARDPLSAIQRLSMSNHGRGGLDANEIVSDTDSWDDWFLLPVVSTINIPGIAEPWGGALRIRFPSKGDDGDLDMFADRLSVLLAPIAAEPTGFRRFTCMAGGWIAATGLYGWSDSDVAFASGALMQALRS